ncbi:Werner syndrome ATP-dependent helicase [Paramuricea clavata]|uniref:DNA 3'-5' helicase n=1 Tax=Paramuricea clavata TaxID=317549 RepID=A0A7D9KAR9_PARCT|nr:Werner syndrome ATP-dependent helicase [Paramuricea clavata]
MAAFRDTYSKLHEMRALAPSVKMIALTATSTQHTRKIIMDVLLMENPYIVYESHNKPNIAYSVCYMPKEANKACILDAFQNDKSEIRVLVATIAFGMGINCKGVYRTIHCGPSKNVESFIQETGREGRDGGQSVSFVLYQGLMLNDVDKYMKQYVKTDCCRRSYLLFKTLIFVQMSKPLCHNICAVTIVHVEHLNVVKFPYSDEEETVTPVGTRTVSDKQQNEILSLLESYHKLALKDLIRKSGLIGLSTSSIKFLLGFSELQISQVLENCDKLFSLDDVVKYVEIWDIRHTHKIMDIINRTFGDGCNIQLDETCEESDDSDDDYLDIPEEWNILLNDDLLDLAVDNLSSF